MAWPWARVCLFPLFPLLIGFWKIGHVHTRILFFSRFPLCEQRQCQTHMGPWLTWVSGIELKPCQTVYSREWWSIRNTVLSPVKSFPELWASKEKLLLYFICQHSCFCIILICFKKKNFFFFLAVPCSMQNLSSLIRDQTHVLPTVEAWSPNHWTTRGFPLNCLLRYLPSWPFLA